MKRFLLILAAAAALVCSCNKYDAQIDDLKNRADAAEASIENVKTKLEALNALLEALEAGISIKSVTPVEGGFTVLFSDGQSFTVLNGADAQVSYTDNGTSYSFDFGDGQTISVDKSGAFAIKVDSDLLDLTPGEALEVPFTIIGDDGTVFCMAESNDYTVTVEQNKLTVYADKVVPGKFVLKAIRNSDSATCAIVFSVSKDAITNVSFQITVSDITETGAISHIVPSNKNVLYYCSIQKKDYVDQFASVKELFEADYATFEEIYGSSYSDYGFDSFDDLFLNGLCVKGDYDDDWSGYLKPGTDYVAYAYALDEDLTLISANATMAEFTTADVAEITGNYLGVATWHDPYITVVYGISDTGWDLPVDVYEDTDKSGLFYFDSPFNYANIAEWFEATPEEMYNTNNWKQVTVTIDASDPDKVLFPFQEMGLMMSSSYGYLYMGAEFQGEYISYGTFKDGVIAFEDPEGLVAYEDVEDEYYYGNAEGYLYITMPSGPASAPASAPVVPAAKRARIYKNVFGNRPCFELTK